MAAPSPGPRRPLVARPAAPTRRWLGVLAAAVLFVSLALLGIAAGGLAASYMSDQIGWDQLADFIGGAMIGLAVGVVVAAVIVLRASPRTRLVLAGLFLVAGTLLGTFVWLRIRAETQNDQVVVPMPRPTAPVDGNPDGTG